jgi:hypothetical protein
LDHFTLLVLVNYGRSGFIKSTPATVFNGNKFEANSARAAWLGLAAF